MFYKLVNNQRKATKKQSYTLIVEGKECETTDEIRGGQNTYRS